jgi:hypothetical protein
MKDCHNSIIKAANHFSGVEVIKSLRWGKGKFIDYAGDIFISIYFENKCPICNDKFSFLIMSSWLKNLRLEAADKKE